VNAVVDHGRFFSTIAPGDLTVRIPACPEWNVEDVVRHVAGGAAAMVALLGRAEADDVVPRDVVREHMTIAKDLPVAQLTSLIGSYPECIQDRPADSHAHLYNGGTTVERQVRHVSSDWGIHRHDVEVALGVEPSMSSERAGDLIPWFTSYIVPRDLDGLNIPQPTIRIIADDAGFNYQQGNEEPAVTVSGAALDILLYLWRRPHGPVTIQGDPVAAASYVGLTI
jgi:uncharacterized protein (TIGR03083 family)